MYLDEPSYEMAVIPGSRLGQLGLSHLTTQLCLAPWVADFTMKSQPPA
jgi:hypothetical protein